VVEIRGTQLRLRELAFAPKASTSPHALETTDMTQEIAAPKSEETGFHRSLGLFDSTMVVAGSMIGSAIFIVSADMSRQLGSSGWVLLSWLIAGVLTVIGALSYGELASMMPTAGGQYVYLREAFSPMFGFLYGWTLFLVIQTGTVAAVAVGFARFLGVLVPAVSETRYLIPPIHIFGQYWVSVSTAQLVAILVILLLTWSNSRGLEYGKRVQNVFTVSKIASLAGIIIVCLLIGSRAAVIHQNFAAPWTPKGYVPVLPGISAATAYGLFIALCISQVGSLFAADAWNNVTFTAGEVKNPRRNIPLSLALGAISVITLYMLVNLAYLFTLPLDAIQHASSDRVATAAVEQALPGIGAAVMAVAIMISTFGCINGMVLAGARAYFAMAEDRLFFRATGKLNRAGVPGAALLVQGIWAALLVLPRTYDTATGKYGSLYSNLLDYVVSAVLLFYILTIAGIFRLRRTRPEANRPYKAFGYPVLPALYIVGAFTILTVLLLYRTATTIPGIVIILSGVPVFFLLRRRLRSR
jgi:APA family basic amino acid/polyamine antiporter